MNRFHAKLLTAVVASLGLTAMASAADLPARTYTKAPVMPPVFNWSGFYIGGFAGYAWADGNAGATEPTSAPGVGYNGLANPNASYGLRGSFLGGGTIGYNWQAPGSNFVFGLEGEAGYLHVRGSAQDPNATAANLSAIDSVNSTRIGDAYGVIAGRIGYAWDRTLLYAKGGVAFVGHSYSFNDSCIGPGAPGCGPGFLVINRSETQTTYAVGAGIEYAFTPNWSLKGEYLYLGTRQTNTSSNLSVAAPANVLFTNSNSDPGIHTVKLGVNYRFNWGAPVVAKY
jgi:outer membrane immunogenic protein